MNKWIKVSDIYPPEDKLSFISNGKKVSIGMYCSLCDIFEDWNHDITIKNVTHWMPIDLPEPPE